MKFTDRLDRLIQKLVAKHFSYMIQQYEDNQQWWKKIVEDTVVDKPPVFEFEDIEFEDRPTLKYAWGSGDSG